MMNDKPGNLEFLNKNIRVPNLVSMILDMKDGERILMDIGTRVSDDRQADRDSMSDWEKYLESGRKLSRQELHGKSEPFENAANFKSPGMLEASLKFGDRAAGALLKTKDLVKADVIGSDKDKEKSKRSERIVAHMNYQLNYEQKSWREDHDRLLYILPSDGASFKCSYYDSGLQENVSEVIRWPSFSVNQSNTSMDKCRSFTIDREYTKSEVIAKQREGVWQEYEGMEFGTETQTEENDEKDSNELFYMQQMYFDLDDDGYEEPYFVTVHANSLKVMRVTARYEEDNIIVKTPNGTVLPLSSVMIGADGLGFNVTGDSEIDMKKSKISQCTLVRINAINLITQYTFIPGDLVPFESGGEFLGIGYFHLLGGLTNAINSSSNTILNAGKLASTPGGFLAKNFKKAKGAIRYKLGQFIPTLMSASDLQNSVREFKFPDVSQSFFMFNDKMRAEVERIAASADLSQAIGANAPATTMLGMVQEQMTPISAIILRIYRSQKQEFIKLAELNKKYSDPVVYRDVVGDDNASYSDDYALLGLDIMPAANPEMTSKIQNILQSSSVLDQADRIVQYGGNPIPILKKYLLDLGVDDIATIFPPDDGENKEDPNLAALKEANQLERDIAQKQVQLFAEQVRNEKAKTAISKAETLAKIREILSRTVLNLEKAETEDTKNQISVYTTEMKALAETLGESGSIQAN
jgi:hypothetical protein